VARFSTEDERGYAYQLPGVDEAAIGFVFLAPEARPWRIDGHARAL
jgi:hypothetical protein